jgi:AmmeMemoRadiSam system protein A
MIKKYQELLGFARETIKAKLNSGELEISEAIKKKYSEKGACFVTLTINGDLRGCIGSLQARQELWKDVIENSLHAAFEDSRFEPLEKNELEKIKIEISVLSVPKKIEYKNSEDLLEKILGKGVVIRKGFFSATYLPQVWEEISDAKEFISSLCLKAGLSADFWKNNTLEVSLYMVEKVKE